MITPEGLDRKFYEICALSELKNAPAPGDIWVKGSRQFRDFDDYLLPAEKFAALQARAGPAPGRSTRTATSTEERFAAAGRAVGHRHPPAKDNELPDAILTESGLKITRWMRRCRIGAGADRPNQPVTAAHQDHRTADGRGRLDGFSRHFTHLKDGAEAKDRTLLLSAILGDAINLG